MTLNTIFSVVSTLINTHSFMDKLMGKKKKNKRMWLCHERLCPKLTLKKIKNQTTSSFHINLKISLSFTKSYPLRFDMHYLGPATTQRQSPQCLYPMVWNKANKLQLFSTVKPIKWNHNSPKVFIIISALTLTQTS